MNMTATDPIEYRHWVTVCTALAPSWLVLLHAKYHRRLGARSVVYFLDAPDQYNAQELKELSETVTVIQCDPAYWERLGGRPSDLAKRQLVNLRVARAIVGAVWVLHIDIDEFLYVRADGMQHMLALPLEISEIRLQNAERVIDTTKPFWPDGYLRTRTTNHALLTKHYGSQAVFYGLGLSHYFHGKSFVKNRKNIKQNIHGAIHAATDWEIIRHEADKHDAFIIHYPCITPRHFASRYLSHLTNEAHNVIEFRHQQYFRQHLRQRAQAIGAEQAVAQGVRELHSCGAETARERLADGLYEPMPAHFLATLFDCAPHDDACDMCWAEDDFARFYARAKHL
jgi:hypothetical protein